ncbi:GntR family transcriptional regulator [Streptomyces sp. NPDC059402]|uniref:GntR family transcriptional regulator n=1 Tax=Streptomyces sp. NPDC059402 TaxID=3346822 RepID=UPI0036975CCC
MKHSAQGAAGPGAGTAAAAVRIPVQPSAADVARDGSRGRSRDRDGMRGAGEPDGAVRGEHTHGEPPAPGPSVPGPSVPGPAAPRPRTLVQRSSVRGQVLDALRAALATGELRPGEVYSAPVLGERFGVSATPVREAMQQLALEGAVEVVPNRGFRVVERGDRELAELAEVRALIEVPVWLRLARTVPAERWAELRPLAEGTARAASSGCPAAYAEADRAFHRAVLALAGNEELVRIAGDVHRRAQWPPAGSPAARGRADLVADAHEHTALLDALIAGDPDAVRALVGQHFAGARRDSGVLGLWVLGL